MSMSKNKLFQIQKVKSHLLIDLKSLASHLETHHLLGFKQLPALHQAIPVILKQSFKGNWDRTILNNRPRFFERVGHVSSGKKSFLSNYKCVIVRLTKIINNLVKNIIILISFNVENFENLSKFFFCSQYMIVLMIFY